MGPDERAEAEAGAVVRFLETSNAGPFGGRELGYGSGYDVYSRANRAKMLFAGGCDGRSW
jgi:hypothetical protein